MSEELVIEFLERVAAGRLDNSLPFTAAHTGDQVARADCIMATINAATVRRLIELARIIRDVAYD